MRPPPAQNQTLSVSTTATPTCNPQTCKWKPYTNSNDFETNAVLVLIILFCALICALALNTAIRCFLRSNRRQTQQEIEQQRKPSLEVSTAPVVSAPTFVYSKGMKLGREEAECVICLTEFVEGDGIQVLGKCKHGFHVQCIQQWLSSHHYSCPTCRCSCLPSSSSPPPSLQETTHQLNLPEGGV